MTSKRDKTYRNYSKLHASGSERKSGSDVPTRTEHAFGNDASERRSVPSVPRVREGPDVDRPSSPAWDLTAIRVRREDKARFDLLRVSRSWDGRVRPHWEVFAELLDSAENT